MNGMFSRVQHVPYPAAVLILLDGAQALLERSLGIDTVQVVERDGVGPQPAEARLDLGPQNLRPAAARSAETSLRRDDDVLRKRGQGLADRLLALPTGVQVSGVDHLHAGFDRGLDKGDVAARRGQTIRPQPNPRHLDIRDPHRLPLHDGVTN